MIMRTVILALCNLFGTVAEVCHSGTERLCIPWYGKDKYRIHVIVEISHHVPHINIYIHKSVLSEVIYKPRFQLIGASGPQSNPFRYGSSAQNGLYRQSLAIAI